MIHRRLTGIGLLLCLTGGAMAAEQDFEVVDGQAEVAGDPGLGRKAGYDNWKAACEKWKEEQERRNKSNEILALDCNSAAYTIDNGLYTFRSTGSYKIKVRVREKAAQASSSESQDSSANPTRTESQ